MYSTPVMQDFLAIIRQHRLITRERLLTKMHIAGHTDITDVDLRKIKTEINFLHPDIILGSRGGRQGGYFEVTKAQDFIDSRNQILNQAYDLLDKASLLERKFRANYPDEWDKLHSQDRLEVDWHDIRPGVIR